jgi:hypothetical protein
MNSDVDTDKDTDMDAEMDRDTMEGHRPWTCSTKVCYSM